jgi:hypothetical protein
MYGILRPPEFLDVLSGMWRGLFEGVERMNRICETCGNEKKSIEGTPQQICTTPSCITMMILMLEKAGIE